MIRFKVIKGSHLLLTAAIVILLAVVGFVLIQYNSEDADRVKYRHGTVNALNMDAQEEAKALYAFASSSQPVNSLEIEIISDIQTAPPISSSPSILIYHTHTHEAYRQVAEAPYEAVESWRTEDEAHSVVRVGRALCDELEKRGCFVVHDVTDHELDDIDLSYVRSLETLESYSVPFDLCIDLHRDAYVDGLLEALEADGKRLAQLMLLVGRGDAYHADERPDYQANLDFAQRLNQEINRHITGLARNVTVKKGRYNQHIGGHALLIEVGHNQNTLEEALASMPYLADSICNTLRTNKYSDHKH